MARGLFGFVQQISQNVLMDEILTKATQFAKKVKSSGIKIEKAYLYGSQAKGTAKDQSDIDICIVSPVFGKDFIKEYVKLAGFSKDIDWRIEAIPFNPERLNDRYDTLAAEIRKYGIPLKV